MPTENLAQSETLWISNDFLNECSNTVLLFREELKNQEDKWREFIESLKKTWRWEVIAQATLAMRHLEDARMRYWKVIQYLWDGVSKFDK